MRTFQDSEKNSWVIAIPYGMVRQVRQASGSKIDLIDPASKVGPAPEEGKADNRPKLIEWLDEYDNFWEVLWYLVESQAKERDIDAVQFGILMAADCLIDAKAMFMEEWRDFFQKLRQPEKALVLEKKTKYDAMALKKAERIANDPALGAKLDARVEVKMEKNASDTYSNLLESLDETLGDTPTES